VRKEVLAEIRKECSGGEGARAACPFRMVKGKKVWQGGGVQAERDAGVLKRKRVAAPCFGKGKQEGRLGKKKVHKTSVSSWH